MYINKNDYIYNSYFSHENNYSYVANGHYILSLQTDVPINNQQ